MSPGTTPRRPGPSVLFVLEVGPQRGGAERYAELLGHGLANRGIRVAGIVFGSPEGKASTVASRLTGVMDEVEHVPTTFEAKALRSAVRRLRPDVLHWNFPAPGAFRGARWLMLPWGRPSVITDHLPMLRYGRRYEYLRAVANRRIAVAIVVGDAARRAAVEHWQRPPRIVVAYNGVPSVPEASRAKPGTAPHVRLLFCGRLTRQKNPVFAVDILRALRDLKVPARLRVVGDGELEEAVVQRVHDLGLRTLVSMAGFSDNVASEMADADLLLSPSEHEGLPFTPVEALAAGLPVLASDIPPHRELAVRGKGVRVLPTVDASSWAESIALARPELAGLAEVALAHAKVYSLEAMVDATLSAYVMACRAFAAAA